MNPDAGGQHNHCKNALAYQPPPRGPEGKIGEKPAFLAELDKKAGKKTT